MTIPQIIVTIATVSGFLAMAIYVAIYGWKVKYPDGQRFDYHGTFKVTVVVHRSLNLGNLKMVALAQSLDKALVAASDAWRGSDGRRLWVVRPSEALDGFCLWILPSHEYEKEWVGWKAMAKSTNGVLGQLHKMIGGGPPVALVRTPYLGTQINAVDDAIDNAGLVIHEALHALRRWDSFHADPEVWIAGARRAGIDESKTVEAQALSIYKASKP